LDIADKRVPRSMAFYQTDKLPGSPEETKKILDVARKGAKKVKSVMPHPSLCLDAIEAGLAKGAEEGLAVEQASFTKVGL
jgi:enoyl-CoA hydratase/3-hydroxyacyl-CoA dehydrogenase